MKEVVVRREEFPHANGQARAGAASELLPSFGLACNAKPPAALRQSSSMAACLLEPLLSSSDVDKPSWHAALRSVAWQIPLFKIFLLKNIEKKIVRVCTLPPGSSFATWSPAEFQRQPQSHLPAPTGPPNWSQLHMLQGESKGKGVPD